jgi:hypothetical protein
LAAEKPSLGHRQRSQAVAFPLVEDSRMMCYLAAQPLIQNGSSRLLISQDFLPQGDTTGRFRGTLRNKCFSRASDTTADLALEPIG